MRNCAVIIYGVSKTLVWIEAAAIIYSIEYWLLTVDAIHDANHGQHADKARALSP
jgi:hypothetical protein